MHTLRRSGTISAADLSASLRDYIVLDIRPSTDWEHGHIPGSLNVRPDHLTEIAAELEARLPTVIVTDIESDANSAARSVRGQGRDAVILDGGFAQWTAAGGCSVHSD